MIKREIRVLGIDDAPFDKFKDKHVLVVGTMYRGGHYMDGLLSTQVTVDGTDATEKLVRMINKSKFKPQLKALFLDGVAVGGFNVIDIEALSKRTKLPVLVVIRNYPQYQKIYAALTKIKKTEEKKMIQSWPKPTKVDKIYIQYVGMTLTKATSLLRVTCTHSYVPEPLRMAHLIAAGIVRGESHGRA